MLKSRIFSKPINSVCIQISLIMFIFSLQSLFAQEPPIAFAIHGGAGTITKKLMTPELEQAYRETLNAALLAGYVILKEGGRSLDAVEAAIVILENSPLFNAGKGAVFTSDGTNELDASIMDGSNQNAGAVSGLKHIKNPIKAARLTLDRSPHVMLVGEGAETFAVQNGLEYVSQYYFFTQRRWDSLVKAKEMAKADGDSAGYSFPDQKKGTVGAVALDRHGNLAAGVSTGGLTNKRYGRVGDSPIIGAGVYANNQTCAISATGQGEIFMRLLVAHDIHAQMLYQGKSLAEASQNAIAKVGKLAGTGGVIAVDNVGNISMPFNTKGMYRGYIEGNEKPIIKIYKNE